jgi:hypothetical protein
MFGAGNDYDSVSGFRRKTLEPMSPESPARPTVDDPESKPPTNRPPDYVRFSALRGKTCEPQMNADER